MASCTHCDRYIGNYLLLYRGGLKADFHIVADVDHASWPVRCL